MQKYTLSLMMAIALLLAPAVSAAITVVDEDFEDDTPSTYFPLPPAVDLAPGLEGLPTNAGNPGNWLANQYHLLPWFNNPWHDDLDTNPDTNWQLQVTANIGINLMPRSPNVSWPWRNSLSQPGWVGSRLRNPINVSRWAAT